MNTRYLAIALVVVLSTSFRTSAEPPPTHQDFRPLTFTRPSSAMSDFYYGGDYARRSNVIVVPYGGYGYGGTSSYYDSVIGNYGASPYSGLDASTSLYTRPIRSLIYPPGVPSQRIGFYESTIPYGDYRLRTHVRPRFHQP